MALLDIVTYPAKSLSVPAKKVETIDDSIRELIEDMAETMYDAPGVGLAAPQVGSEWSIIVYDDRQEEEEEEGVEPERRYRALINPEIVSMEGQVVSEEEGCLSVPDYRADVKRAETVVVTALDINGDEVKIETGGFLSIVLQHEIDHLKGVLFIDRISSLKREMYKRRVKKMMKAADK
jgi:peptide deformylase